MPATVAVARSDAHRLHAPPWQVEEGEVRPAQETPARAEAIARALQDAPWCTPIEVRRHGLGPVEAVHDPAMVRYLAEAWDQWAQAFPSSRAIVADLAFPPALTERAGVARREPAHPVARAGWWLFDTQTAIVAGTFTAAREAADLAVSAADAVAGGAGVAYALCRPPGHHAARSVMGGYCYFNHAAIAAEHLVRRGATRVAVLDVDLHHGNGTQQVFAERPDVFFGSVHGDPARTYPYLTGHADETGHGAGRGTTLNVPLPAGAGDTGWLAGVGRLVDAAAAFRAEAVVVSLGVDAWGGDPMSDLDVTAAAFDAAGAQVRELGLPTVVVQEGGYALEAIGDLVLRFLAGLAGAVTSSAGR